MLFVKRIMAEKARQTNIELLRILSMVLIIGHHIAVHSGFSFGTDITFNRLFIQFLSLGGKIGVDVFVLISGYFLIFESKIKVQKIIRFVSQCLFYSIVIYVLFCIFGKTSVSIKGIIKALVPIASSQWWFVSTYFVIYLFSPFINKLLSSLDKKSYLLFLLLMFFCWCFVPTFTTLSYQFTNLGWFLFLYSLAGYYRIHQQEITLKCSTCFIIAIGMYFLTFLSAVVFDLLGRQWEIFSSHATYFYGMEKLPILIISVAFLMAFSKLNVKNNHITNAVASTTFGIYLIHDSNYVRPFLWIDLFKNAEYQNSTALCLHCLTVLLVVFVGCSVIDYVRIKVLEKPYMRCVNKILTKTEMRFSQFRLNKRQKGK